MQAWFAPPLAGCPTFRRFSKSFGFIRAAESGGLSFSNARDELQSLAGGEPVMANHVNSSHRNAILRRKMFAFTTLILAFSLQVYSQPKNSADTAASFQSFLGRWDLTLKTPGHDSPSWLEITQEDGKLRAREWSAAGDTRGLSRKLKSPMAGSRSFLPRKRKNEKTTWSLSASCRGRRCRGPLPDPMGLSGNGQAFERHR